MSTIIHAQGVSKWFGEVIAVNNCTLNVGTGVVGLLGANGAGKSTLFKMLAGLIDFEKRRSAWVANTRNAWRKALVPPTATTQMRLDAGAMTLIGDDVVEMKILSGSPMKFLYQEEIEERAYECTLRQVRGSMARLRRDFARHGVRFGEATQSPAHDAWLDGALAFA